MNERTVARVVGIVFGAAGRAVTDATIDAWAVILAEIPDRGDEIAVAAELARAVDFATAAQFYKALRRSRRRRALSEATRMMLSRAENDFLPPSNPVAWRAYSTAGREAGELMGTPVYLPDEVPPGVPISHLISKMFLPPEKAPAT